MGKNETLETSVQKADTRPPRLWRDPWDHSFPHSYEYRSALLATRIMRCHPVLALFLLFGSIVVGIAQTDRAPRKRPPLRPHDRRGHRPGRRLHPRDRPTPAELHEMETWWCETHPGSKACHRLTLHHMDEEARREAVEKHRAAVREEGPEAMKAERSDIDEMHRAWCKSEKGGLDHATCKAWLWTRDIKKEEL